MSRKRTFAPFVPCFILAVGLSAQAAVEDIGSLLWITEEYEPYNFTRNGAVSGIFVDTLKLMWAELGIDERPIQVLPWARGYQMLESRPGTVLFATARTESRENLFAWVGPVASNRYVVFTRAADVGRWPKMGDLAARRSATVRKDVAEQLLLEKGVPDARITRVENISAAIRMLASKRVDFVAYGEYSFNKAVSELGLAPDGFAAVFVLQESPLYFALHRSTDDAVVAELQAALDAVKKKPEYEGILDRYR